MLRTQHDDDQRDDDEEGDQTGCHAAPVRYLSREGAPRLLLTRADHTTAVAPRISITCTVVPTGSTCSGS